MSGKNFNIIGNTGDIAAAATFLLDDSASWITGQVIAVDGGMGALRTFKLQPCGRVRWVPHV